MAKYMYDRHLASDASTTEASPLSGSCSSRCMVKLTPDASGTAPRRNNLSRCRDSRSPSSIRATSSR
eukprot:2205444-Pleurochrysis_carterae.AAC.2